MAADGYIEQFLMIITGSPLLNKVIVISLVNHQPMRIKLITMRDQHKEVTKITVMGMRQNQTYSLMDSLARPIIKAIVRNKRAVLIQLTKLTPLRQDRMQRKYQTRDPVMYLQSCYLQV